MLPTSVHHTNNNKKSNSCQNRRENVRLNSYANHNDRNNQQCYQKESLDMFLFHVSIYKRYKYHMYTHETFILQDRLVFVESFVSMRLQLLVGFCIAEDDLVMIAI